MAARLLSLLTVLLVAALSSPVAVGATTQITGKATSCSSFSACIYSLTSGAQTGSASTYGASINYLLPGEAKMTTNQPFQTKTLGNSGATYHIGGSFNSIDANTEKLVTGTTDDYITQTQHCSRTGCYYTYALVSGTITFTPTNEDGTSTSVVCNPSTFAAGGSTKCTVTVTDLASSASHPTGKVRFSISPYYYGTFKPTACSLSAGKCTVQFIPSEEQVGSVPINAAYPGDATHYLSSTTVDIFITPSA